MNPSTPGLNWFRRTHAELMSVLDSSGSEDRRDTVTTAAALPFFFWLCAVVLVAPHLSWPAAGFIAVLLVLVGVAFWVISLLHG